MNKRTSAFIPQPSSFLLGVSTMRLVSKKLIGWLNIWLIFTLVGSLLSPISLASASSLGQNNGSLVRESQANSENDTILAINGLTGKEAIASNNNQSPVQLNGATPRTFSLPFNSNLGTILFK